MLAGPGDKRQMLALAGRIAAALAELRFDFRKTPVAVQVQLGCTQTRPGDSVTGWYERAVPQRAFG